MGNDDAEIRVRAGGCLADSAAAEEVLTMAQLLTLEPDCRFAILALHGVSADVPNDLILQDGTKVLTSFPFELDGHWKDWLGTIQVNALKESNLFLLRTATGGWRDRQLSVHGGTVDAELQSHIYRVFTKLRLLGAIRYDNAFILGGHVISGVPECRSFAPTEHFYITLGCLPLMIRENDLRTAVELQETYSRLGKRY
jgi:hypothetical protein